MSTNSVRTSVIIIVYNCERYIGEAIESVLSQSVPADEVIVVDDGSTDSTPSILQRYAAKCILVRQDNSGPSSARNAGVRASTGDFISFLDADDIWASDKLEIQLEYFRRAPKLDIVFGNMKHFISPEITALEKSRITCPTGTHRGELPGIALIRRTAFEKIGEFDQTFHKGEGIDWYSRMVDSGVSCAMPAETVYYRRLYKCAKPQSDVSSMRDYALVLKKTLDRRRQGVE